jgi:glycosyltransferase involved in cell wall biosynthesis
MRICLDARFRVQSGSSSYISNLVPRLLSLAEDREFVLLKYPEQEFPWEDRVGKILLAPKGSDLRQVVWTTTALPRILERDGVDLFHAMKMPGPIWSAVDDVITMHSIFDPYRGRFPVSLKTRLFLTFLGTPALKRAKRLVAVSGFVKDYLVDRAGVDPDRIDVIYHGLDARFRRLPLEQVDAFRDRMGLPEDYLLCVGNVTPVKNHLTAVRALHELRDEVPACLVIAGGQTHKYYGRVRLKLEDRVITPGFVGGEDLVLLMNGAKALLFPSLTEGCPVTMLEAFGCGLPPVASRRGGLWDLGKDRALFVDDPTDHRGFAREALRLLHSPGLRGELGEKGLAAAREHTWEAAARNHLETYSKVL